MSIKVIEFIHGPLDGTVREVPSDLREIRVPTLNELNQLNVDLHKSTPTAVGITVHIYGPKTEVDYHLNRWSLLRTEKA